MSLSFADPQLLWLTPLAALPLLGGVLRRSAFPSLASVPVDGLSRLISLALTFTAVATIGSTALALAGPRRGGELVEKIGDGAETALLIDRSGSMNETFAGRPPEGGEESKANAARRVLQDYVRRRQHDRFGVVGFSTSPIRMLPLTDKMDAVLGAVAAIDRPGLDYTDIGRGLATALSLLSEDAGQSSRVLLLVSDGAAVIDPKVQQTLRTTFARTRVNLYWLFLRTANSTGISDTPKPGEDTPQAMPERHLDIFFKSLKIPYKAFEVENPGAVEAAVAEIGRLETHPIVYRERLPTEDLTGFFAALALLSSLALVAAKIFEAGLFTSSLPLGLPEAARPSRRRAA
ncbi:vWA domain-containing protein [Methylocella silvestris]|uniref:VWA domain-containing protein n=1 Tax=Methylocella silvestris TaxID=199596 RepID=A0A2J7TEV0_METSI|nr:vWA domain-containing protein [Methylocella silvestris]PNG25287.1 VWA domain-containing protein [Methylocella silvestris]